MKVSNTSADAMFPFSTPTGSMTATKKEVSASASGTQNSFNDFECVPESKVAEDKAAQGDTHFF